MKFEQFRSCVTEAARELGIAEYELYYASSSSVSVGAFRHEISDFSDSTDGGVCFRCLVNGKMGYASTEELSAENARAIVRRAADNAASLENEEQEFLGEGGKTYREIERKEYPLPPAGELTGLALAGQDALYSADPCVIDGSRTNISVGTEKIAIVNSKGLDLSADVSYAVQVCSAVVQGDGEMSNSYEFRIGDPGEFPIADIAAEAVKNAKAKLAADIAPTGNYPVVFAPKAMSSLLSVYSGIFSSDAARKGLSRLLNREGEKIASDIVTITDDPFYPESAVPMCFDAEGSPTYTKNLVENGELKTLLYHLKSAAAAGRETTGNASKAAYDSKVDIRPFTLFIRPGQISEEELIRKAGNGVYIDFLGGLHAGANAITGDFSLQSAGFLIENGVKTKAVKSFTVAGNFYDLLKNITALSDRAEYRGTGGITGFACPAVLAEGLSVAGK